MKKKHILTVTMRADGRFMGKYKDNTGKYRYVYSRDKRDCINRLREAIAECEEGITGVRLYTYIDDWRNNFKKPKVKPSTLSAIDSAIRLYIKKGLPNIRLADLNGMDIQRFLLSIEKSRTRKSVYDVLNEAFKKAVALRYIIYNPMLAVEIPTHRQNKGAALTDEELNAFLNAISGRPIEYYFKFLLFTGCRRSEALAITWNDVDFEKSTVLIPGTKTESSYRLIPMFEDLKILLESIPGDRQGRIFCFNCDYVTHKFKIVCPNHKLHDLRHTFATKCLSCGIPLKVVQEWLGHSRLETTADIYTHVSSNLNFSEANKLKW